MPEAARDSTTPTDRFRLFFQAHGLRVGAAAVVIAALLIVAAAPATSQGGWLAFFSPLIVGALAVVASHDPLTAGIDGWRQFFEQRLEKAQAGSGKFSQYFLRPLFSGSVSVWKTSDAIPDPHLRGGVRLSVVTYFWALMLFALAVAVYVALVIVMVVVALLIIAWMLSRATGGAGESRTIRTGGSFFTTACSNCGSKDHASGDCPHGIFSSNCSNCGSRNHASSDCPHGMFSSKCSNCGSTDHASSDCPHGMFSSACSNCGSNNHASSDCPHGMFSSACSNCGSKEHSSADCPH